MYITIMSFGDDEVLALRELQKTRGFTSNFHLSDEKSVDVDVAKQHVSGALGHRLVLIIEWLTQSALVVGGTAHMND